MQVNSFNLGYTKELFWIIVDFSVSLLKQRHVAFDQAANNFVNPSVYYSMQYSLR